jgi:hypothetical protein
MNLENSEDGLVEITLRQEGNHHPPPSLSSLPQEGGEVKKIRFQDSIITTTPKMCVQDIKKLI